MESVSKRYKDYIKASGGKNKAEREALSWLTEAAKDRTNEELVELQSSHVFMPGKMYMFQYNAKTYLDPLPYFDTKPTIISLGVNTNVKPFIEIGININYLPDKVAEKFLNKLAEGFDSQLNESTRGRKSYSADSQDALRINYSIIKPLIEAYHLGFAVKNYIPTRKGKIKSISYENWHKGILIDQDGFKGATRAKVHRDYGQYIKDKLKK